uniref:Uncharacterized protein n=1 Tax=Chlamydomonas euryale TaxID=1486919 RepID=A0A7R9VMS7_9CHLO
MRCALLEWGCDAVAARRHSAATACLRHAAAATAKRLVVLQSNHVLAPVAVAQLPGWAVEHARGQEEAFGAAAKPPGGGAAVAAAGGASPLPDATLSRRIVCHFAALCRASEGAPAGLPASALQTLHAQHATLHAALKAACPKYASDACFQSVPLPPRGADADRAPAPAPGTVLVQWLVHTEGTPRELSSFEPSGTLPASGLVPAQVLRLKPVPMFATMLFVVMPPAPGGMTGAGAAVPAKGGKGATPTLAPSADADALAALRLGERTLRVDVVRDTATRAKLLRHRLEAPRAENELFGDAVPSDDELAALRGSVEALLSGGAQASGRSSHSGMSDAADPGSPGAGGGVALGGGGGSGGSGHGVDAAFLMKLEAMLSLDSGIDIVDGELAAWLATLLQPTAPVAAQAAAAQSSNA